jgi:DNA-binding transcriptional LysR family regulator
MKWRRLDLNLLVVFDALMRERNATRAADRLNMSQPAVSHALTRLRAALRDDLFIRTPTGMAPTARAARLAEPVRRMLEGLRVAVDSAADFSPADADYQFNIAVNNRAALVIVPPVAAAVAAEAPGVSLDLRPSGTLDVAELLDRGELDVAIGGLAAPGERFADLRLFEDGFVVILRRDHPAIKAERAMTAENLAGLTHLAVTSTGEETDFVDAEFERLGLVRRIALRAPLLSSAALLAQSDMVAILTQRTARAFAKTAPLQVLPLPFASPHVTTAALWHRRLDDAPAHRWLRGIVHRVARSL